MLQSTSHTDLCTHTLNSLTHTLFQVQRRSSSSKFRVCPWRLGMEVVHTRGYSTIFPHTRKRVTTWKEQCSFSFFMSIYPLSFISGTIWCCKCSHAVTLRETVSKEGKCSYSIVFEGTFIPVAICIH